MKKLLYLGILLFSIIGMSSCNYDDSNDIDILVPGDSTQTGLAYSKTTLLRGSE